MTVEELIKELKKFYPKMEVQNEIFQTLHPITKVKKIKVKKVSNQKKKSSIVVIS